MIEAYSQQQHFEQRTGPAEDLGDMRDILNACRDYERLSQETYKRLMKEDASAKSPNARVYDLVKEEFLGFSHMVTFVKDGNDELVFHLGQKPFGNLSVQRYANTPGESPEIVEMFAFDSRKPASSAAEALPYLKLLDQSTSQFGKPRE